MSFEIDNPLEAWAQDAPLLAEKGFIMPEAVGYLTPEMKANFTVAMDAVPASLLPANAALPALFTTYIDPEVIRIRFAPVKAAEIAGERKMGDWLMDTAMFSVVEATGETSAYGDFAENGRSGINQDFPQRQSFHFQVMEEIGEREAARADLTKLNYVSEVQVASAENLNRFSNYSYCFGIQGLQNYGLLNDPYLPGSLTPAQKAYGGTKWIVNNAVVATANEVFNDIQSGIGYVISATQGNLDLDSEWVLGLPPTVVTALTATNSFGIKVRELLKENFQNLDIKLMPQYGALSSTNPQGVAAGNMYQLFARKFDGSDSVFCAYTEKMRGHRMEMKTSSWKRKITSGTWGAVVRYPVAFTSMIGL